ncbi:hypothetical protein D5S18_23140 [Nocardia panacis]|uniref:Uncharacterized protein n=1 Tax=Nocardia panacis TaxID=2340916 RepID=A0A3A4KQE7_9NOCA|nr:hypothetical protein D5S18_23140 [Nocardia panacis]
MGTVLPETSASIRRTRGVRMAETTGIRTRCAGINSSTGATTRPARTIGMGTAGVRTSAGIAGSTDTTITRTRPTRCGTLRVARLTAASPSGS